MQRLSRRTYLPWILFLAGFALGGCGKYFYKPKPSLLPPYIHTLAVQPFANHTQQYGLEDKLTLALQSEFSRDGRYQITTPNVADGVVMGDITRYILEPLSYDVNHIPTEYKLTIFVDVSFMDKVKNAMLWKEPNMAGELRYFVATSGLAGSMTEVDAQQTIWDQLSRDIATRTFEGFGTVNGASDKSLLNPDRDQPSQNNPPPQPSDQPSSPPTQLPY
jgi:hypothetical protein